VEYRSAGDALSMPNDSEEGEGVEVKGQIGKFTDNLAFWFMIGILPFYIFSIMQFFVDEPMQSVVTLGM
jgi:hypothetical protein